MVSEAEFDAFIKNMNLNQNQPPTSKQLLLVAIASGVPFIGFGCCDNSIMILAGDYIPFFHSCEIIVGNKKNAQPFLSKQQVIRGKSIFMGM
jgi:hypothetical protein